jgi:adenylylsulfate kinase
MTSGDDSVVSNVHWHDGYVGREDFERRNGHGAAVIWLTGLSGAGKSSIAREVEWALYERGIHTRVLDGDNTRHGLNSNLGFSPEDRKENVRRVAEVARLFFDAGAVVLVALISPYQEDRAAARQLIAAGGFLEVFVKCDLETCIQRDPKGLYKKALAGLIPEYTGVSAPYEVPEAPELVLDTGTGTLEGEVARVLRLLEEKCIIISANRQTGVSP